MHMRPLIATLLLIITISTAHAASLPYRDVPKDAWYGDALAYLLKSQVLDATKTRFRADASATRAEFLKIVTEFNGGIVNEVPKGRTFSDVPATAWYHPYFSEAKKEGWLTGDADCVLFGKSPCTVRPDAVITRAEAASLLVRAYALGSNGTLPLPADVQEDAWYAESVQAAVDNCIFQPGDANTVRPLDPLNRAEMAVMLFRLETSMNGTGPACEAGYGVKLLKE